MAIKLRDYQERFITKIRGAFSLGLMAVMAVASTGAGKTICFSYIADGAQQLVNTTFIVVHRKQLVRQTSKSLSKNGIEHGVIAAKYKEEDKPIQVCSMQTLVNRLHLYRAPTLLVIDEAHHATSKTYKKILAWAKAGGSRILGVTATPSRTDGQGFDNDFDTMVECDDIEYLIKEGWLVEPTVYAPPVDGQQIDTSELHVQNNGDYAQQEMLDLIDKPVITGSAVENYQKVLPHLPPTVVFCISVDHAEHVAQEFRDAGIPAKSIDGSMNDEQREQIVYELETGVIRVLTSCDLVSEGFDLPALQCAIMLRPISQKCISLFMQQVGRILRPADGKTQAYLFDHVQNWKRHGWVQDKRDWWAGFHGRMKGALKAKGSTLTNCPKCYCVFPPAPVCPNADCGHKFKEAGGLGPGREIEETEGELVKLNRDDVLTFKVNTGSGGLKKQVIRKLERA